MTDLDAAEEFYVERLGLVATARIGGALYLRGWEEHLHHSLVLRQAADAGRRPHRVPGARGRGPGALGKRSARSAATAAGRRARAARAPALRVLDPFGFPLEFFRAMDVVEPLTQAFHLQRGAPIMRFDHVNLHVTHVERTLEHWLDLGFRCSEYISTDGARSGSRRVGAPQGDRARPALTTGRGPRLHHVGLYGTEPMGVAPGVRPSLRRPGRLHRARPRPARRLQRALRLPARPGRPPPGALRRRLLHGGPRPPADPLEHEDPRRRTFWGPAPPPAGSKSPPRCSDLDGRAVAVTEADVEERSHLLA